MIRKDEYRSSINIIGLKLGTLVLFLLKKFLLQTSARLPSCTEFATTNITPHIHSCMERR